MPEYLIADIGGTHSRLALAGDGISHIRIFDNAGYDGLEALLEDYLNDFETPPSGAALAVASPLDGDRVRMTNLGWTFSIATLCDRFGFESCRIINDFAAIALAVPVLSEDDLVAIRPGERVAGRPAAVIGPGTGLGVSALVPRGEEWLPVASEGGHVTLAAATEEEARIIAMVRREVGHVSAERLLSGPGLALMYRILGGDDNDMMPERITALAVSGEDDVAVQALDHFLAMLGTVAGNLALTLGAQGGVYLAGGILPGMVGILKESRFGERFIDKGRYRDYLKAIPVFLITRANPALLGLHAHLRGKSAASNAEGVKSCFI